MIPTELKYLYLHYLPWIDLQSYACTNRDHRELIKNYFCAYPQCAQLRCHYAKTIHYYHPNPKIKCDLCQDYQRNCCDLCHHVTCDGVCLCLECLRDREFRWCVNHDNLIFDVDQASEGCKQEDHLWSEYWIRQSYPELYNEKRDAEGYIVDSSARPNYLVFTSLQTLNYYYANYCRHRDGWRRCRLKYFELTNE